MNKSVTNPICVSTRLSDNGRIVIPAEIREAMGLKPGESLQLTLEAGVLQIESHAARVRRIQEEFKQYAKPGVLASDELIDQRGAEAQQEMEEWLG